MLERGHTQLQRQVARLQHRYGLIGRLQLFALLLQHLLLLVELLPLRCYGASADSRSTPCTARRPLVEVRPFESTNIEAV